MEGYILRIYRRNGRKARILVGTVEEVGKEGKKSFSSYAELWEILDPKKEAADRSEGRRKIAKRVNPLRQCK